MTKKFLITNVGAGTYNSLNPLDTSNIEKVFDPTVVDHVHSFTSLIDIPTTIGGYGITDVYTMLQSDNRFFNVTGDTVTGDSSFIGKTDYDGDVYYNTQNGQKGVYLSRYEQSATEFVKMYLEDIVANFYYLNDERHARFKFTIDNTDTESNAGANANLHTFEFLGNEFGAFLYLDGQEIIHSGNISNYQSAVNWVDILGKPTIPTNNNQLTNGQSYINATQVPSNETDPTVPAHVKSITTTEKSNWNTGFNKRITGLSITGTSTKTITITLADSTTVVGSFTDISSSGTTSDGNDYVTGGNFNTSTGQVTLTRIDGGTVVFNLDNRYELIFAKNTAFNKNFAGNGSASTVSRSDHTHAPVNFVKTTKQVYSTTYTLIPSDRYRWLSFNAIPCTVIVPTGLLQDYLFEGEANDVTVTFTKQAGVTLRKLDTIGLVLSPNGVFGVRFRTTDNCVLYGTDPI